ncbi:TPA: MFS transporter, partial [Raoultella ornithinolytica]
LTETIDSERTIRQAERFFIDSNMILNLPDFVSFIFTTKKLPSASLISPIKVRKRQLKIFSVSPDIAAAAAPVKIMLDFDDDDKPSAPDVMTTHQDLFFDESAVKPTNPKPDNAEHFSPLDF